MSWLFSRALVEAYSEADSSAGAPCAQLNATPSPHPFSRNDKTTDASSLSRFGPTFAALTADRGAALLTSFLAASRARTSASPERATGSTERARVFGESSPESLARFDPLTYSWKTHQRSLFEEGFGSLETLPEWGMTRAGELFQLQTPSGLSVLRASITSESASGSPERFRTPTATAGDSRSSGSRNLPGSNAHPGVSLTDFVRTGDSTTSRRLPTPTAQAYGTNRSPSPNGATRPSLDQIAREEAGGPLNPTWVEWLMNWPLGWTDLNSNCRETFDDWLRKTSRSENRSANDPAGTLREMRETRDGPASSGPLATAKGESILPEASPRKRCGDVEDRRATGSEEEVERSQQGENLSELREEVRLRPRPTNDLLPLVRESDRLEKSWWKEEPVNVPRMARGVVNRVDRLKCTGNGQVPAVVELAHALLTR